MTAMKPAGVLGAALLFATAMASAQETNVVFIDGGYAEMCSDAAKGLDLPGNNVTVTGTRLEITPLEVCNRAIDDRATSPPDLAASYNNRGVIEFHSKDYALALRDFDKATSLSPELAAAWINKGYTLVVLQKWGDSLMAFDRGIELGPPDPAKAYYNRGLAHEEAGHVREAYLDYKMASELAPDWPEPKNELSRFQIKTKP